MVHCFMVNNRRMALDAASGALHVLDETAYKALCCVNERIEAMTVTARFVLNDPTTILAIRAALPQLSTQEAEEILDELRQLIDAGQLYTPDAPEEVAAFMRRREPVVKALCLHIAHACNLRCAYCFAGQGAYGGTHGLMTPEVGRKAVDFLIANSGKRRNLEIDFFGGEPMLGFETVKAVVAYGRARETETGKHFRFTLTTNGTLLSDEVNAYINAHMDNVVLSIDGRPATNDRMRANADGQGSYADILPKLKHFADSRNQDRYYVRGTYTRYNTDFAADVLHLADVGFKRISVEPVVAPMTAAYAIQPDDVLVLCAAYEKLAAALWEREQNGCPVHFFHFDISLDGGPCVAKRVTGCGAGTEYLAVTPEGTLYPCHQFVGDDGYRIGHLDTGIKKPALRERFANCDVFAKDECTHCWAKYYCGGGCAANAYHTNGDILQPDPIACALQKKRVECALYLHAERSAAQ